MTPEVRVNQSLDERIKEFRSDPEKMEVTTKFVNEVVETAKSEATKRMKEREKEKDREKEKERGRQTVPNTNFESGGGRKRGRWHSRARGFFSRILASFCFCSTETQV